MAHFSSPLCHTTVGKKRILKCAWEVLGTLPILPIFGSIGMKQSEGRKGRVMKGRGGREEEGDEIGK
jgi:hypothetical protein